MSFNCFNLSFNLPVLFCQRFFHDTKMSLELFSLLEIHVGKGNFARAQIFKLRRARRLQNLDLSISCYQQLIDSLVMCMKVRYPGICIIEIAACDPPGSHIQRLVERSSLITNVTSTMGFLMGNHLERVSLDLCSDGLHLNFKPVLNLVTPDLNVPEVSW